MLGIFSTKISLESHLGSDALNASHGSHGSNGSGQLAVQQGGNRGSEADVHMMDMASKSPWILLPRRPKPRRNKDGDVFHMEMCKFMQLIWNNNMQKKIYIYVYIYNVMVI